MSRQKSGSGLTEQPGSGSGKGTSSARHRSAPTARSSGITVNAVQLRPLDTDTLAVGTNRVNVSIASTL